MPNNDDDDDDDDEPLAVARWQPNCH